MLVTPRVLQTPSPPTHRIQRAGGSVSIQSGGGVLLSPLAGQPITLGEFLIQNGKAQPAVSAAGTGRLNFNSTTNKWEVSENGGSWMNLMGASSGNAPVDAQYVTLIANATLTNERVLTGTANQITVTDGGAGGNVTLSTPQNLHTAASPTFAGLTLSALTAGSVLFAGTSGVLSQNNANLFWDNVNNRLGIGTTTPSVPLDIQREGASSSLFLVAFSNSQVEGAFNARRARGTQSAPTIVGANDNVGGYYFVGYDGAVWVNSSSVQGFIDASPGASSMPGRLVFSTTASGSSSLTERMRITNTGALILGNGDTSATPSSPTLRGTNGVGTNINAGTMNIISSLGTGTGTQGILAFQAATNRLGTGSTLQTAVTLFQIGEVQATHPALRGAFTSWPAQTWTDYFTAASGTATTWAAHAVLTPTIAANNLTVTTSDAATFYVANQPTAGTNMTITRGWSAWFDAGDIRIDDNLQWMSGTSFFGTFDHAITANRTWTFPDATDTLVGKATTDTLTNKTLGATTLAGTLSRAADQIIDLTGAATRTLTLQNSTASQVTNLDVDGVYLFRNNTAFTMTLTGTPTANRIFTFPDVADDTLVMLATTQTLTNKTLTAPTFSGTVAGTYTVGGTPTLGVNLTVADAVNLILNATTGTKIGTATTQKIGFLGSAPVAQQVSGANLTNNVTAGGVDDTIANYTDLATYSNDAAAIRNNIYQLARKLKQVNDALRLYGFLS